MKKIAIVDKPIICQHCQKTISETRKERLLAILIYEFHHNDEIAIQGIDKYRPLMDWLADQVSVLGIRCKKTDHKIETVNDKNEKKIMVNEYILEKIGSIR